MRTREPAITIRRFNRATPAARLRTALLPFGAPFALVRGTAHNGAMQERSEAEQALRQLVDEYRSRCLWFLRSDYYPVTDEEARRALDYIERYGDREAFLRVAAIRRWLSPTSSAPSAGS